MQKNADSELAKMQKNADSELATFGSSQYLNFQNPLTREGPSLPMPDFEKNNGNR